MTPEEVARIIGSSRTAAVRAILSVWSDSELREAVMNHFGDRAGLVEFIIDEDVLVDEMELYFDFAAYPDHEAPLRAAGILT